MKTTIPDPLPYDMWKKLIDEGVEYLINTNQLEEDSLKWYPEHVELILNLEASGFSKTPTGIVPKTSHRILIRINRDFPYPNGLMLLWLSDIFHPNIYSIEVSGSSWGFGNGMVDVTSMNRQCSLRDIKIAVEAIKQFIENPEYQSPLNYDVCLEASKYFWDL